MVDESRFRNETTLRLFYGERVRRYPPTLAQRTQNKLKIVYAASRLDDVAVPPGNRLEALKRDRRGNGAFASTSNGEFALFGTARRRWRSRWSTTIERMKP